MSWFKRENKVQAHPVKMGKVLQFPKNRKNLEATQVYDRLKEYTAHFMNGVYKESIFTVTYTPKNLSLTLACDGESFAMLEVEGDDRIRVILSQKFGILNWMPTRTIPASHLDRVAVAQALYQAYLDFQEKKEQLA